MASTAVSAVANAEIIITGVSELTSFAFLRTPIPSISSIRISVIIRSNISPSSLAHASSPLAAKLTAYPCLVSKISRNSRILSSSSTTRIEFIGLPDNPSSNHSYDRLALHSKANKG